VRFRAKCSESTTIFIKFDEMRAAVWFQLAAVKKPAVVQEFGVRLRRLREAKGWTLAELADRAEVGSATVFRVEKGQHAASLDVLACLAEALGMTVSELLAMEPSEGS
jgi:ribosome-binding protein aMBF1 (putative translation factor)